MITVVSTAKGALVAASNANFPRLSDIAALRGLWPAALPPSRLPLLGRVPNLLVEAMPQPEVSPW